MSAALDKCLALGLFCLLMAASTFAGDLYKWQDKNGVWHFSSIPPAKEQSFTTVEMPADPTPLVSMRKLGIEREPEYSFFNNLWGPVELELRAEDADNVSSEPPLPARFILPGQTEQRLVKFKASD